MARLKHHHTHVTSGDLQKAAEFYTKVLGARLVAEWENKLGKIVDVELGGIPIRISSATGADKNWTTTYGLHHLGLEVDDMDDFSAKMRASGVEFVVEPSGAPTGPRAAFIKGPDNVLFEVLEVREQ